MELVNLILREIPKFLLLLVREVHYSLVDVGCATILKIKKMCFERKSKEITIYEALFDNALGNN